VPRRPRAPRRGIEGACHVVRHFPLNWYRMSGMSSSSATGPCARHRARPRRAAGRCRPRR
jgi:hypothetical protein